MLSNPPPQPSQKSAHPLRLHPGEGQGRERHATGLELFFDLVFVLAIAELAHLLHSDYSGSGIVGFAAVYTALRLVIIFLYMQAWRFVPQSRELTARYVISFSIAFFLWLVSIAVPAPARFWLWALALLIEISNGPITYFTIRNVPTQKSHMDERFGLFVIIVLGEAIIAVASGVGETDWQWGSVLTATGGFLTAVSLWWMYFERADESAINRALRGGKMALFRSYIYGYSHVLAFIGIVATGVGIQFAIEAAAGEPFVAEMRTVLCGGIATFLMGVTTLQWASPSSLPVRVILARSLLAILSLCLIPITLLSPVVIVGLLSLLILSLNKFDGIPVPTRQA